MTDQHPITPPPELVEQWRTAPEYASDREMLLMVSMTTRRLQEIADQAARWGADMELNACCEFENKCYGEDYAAKLRRHRRPQPNSLAGEALKELAWVDKNVNGPHLNKCDAVYTIRRALEHLQELEGRGDD